jgi:signal transduction histidine kinase
VAHASTPVAGVGAAAFPGRPHLRAPTPRAVFAAGPVAFSRMIVVVALATIGSFWPHPTTSEAAAFYLWGLGWLPWSILTLFVTDGSPRRFGRIGGAAGDFVALLATLALLPAIPGLVLAGLLVALVACWITCPELPRWAPAAVIVGVSTVIRIVQDPTGRTVVGAASFAIIVLLMWTIWVRMDRMTSRAEILTSSLRSRAETVLARVPHPLVISDPKGRLVNCNPATIEMIGAFDSGTECFNSLGLHYGERALDCSSGCALLALCQTAEGGHVELWRNRVDGSRQPLLATAAEIPDSAGRVVEIVHSLRDITKLKEAEEAKTIFLATASHELKTPLTVINGYAQLLLRDDSNPTLRRQGLDAIAARAKELADIVERLLLSSRIESGRLAVSLESLDLAATVRERTEALATATNHTVSLHIDADLPRVDADVAATATILDHLVDNAIKYSANGHAVDVTVSASDDSVVLSVADHGVGMSEDQRRHCFEKFWQAESGDSRSHGGTGLGLYIVKSLVDSMSGQITVDSRPGEGTTFNVALPTVGRPVPTLRPSTESEPSMIREFMRQIGVPNAAGD